MRATITLTTLLLGFLGGVVPRAAEPAFPGSGAIIYKPAPPGDPGSLIKRFVDPMIHQTGATFDTVLNSDDEHAASAALVVTPNTPVYLRMGNTQEKRPLGNNLVMINGRVFVNFEADFDPEKLPRLSIRPIDGGAQIPWLARIQVTPRSTDFQSEGQVELTVGVPAIFSPELAMIGSLVEGKKVQPRIRQSQTNDSFEITISLHPRDFVPGANGGPQSCLVFLAGVLKLQPYETTSLLSCPELGEFKLPDPLIGLARLIRGRDYAQEAEKEMLQNLAHQIIGPERDLVKIVTKINAYVAGQVRYFRNSMLRSPMQVVREGIGDCDDYTRLMIALLRSLGIPCSAAIGSLYDFNNYGAHAWVEVALPQKNGTVHWFICDPTLASAAQDKNFFVRFKNRIYLYPLAFDLRVVNLPVNYSADILLNCADETLKKSPSIHAWQALIGGFCDDLEKSLTDELAAFANLASNLAPRREFLYAPASDFILVDQLPETLIPDYKDIREPDRVIRLVYNAEKTKEPAHWQIKVTAQDDLVFELGVMDDDLDLESPVDQKFIVILQTLYKQLKADLVRGQEVRHCLEMSYSRDKHTDRLQKVTIRVSRYLVEQHFGKILKILQSNRLLLSADTLRLDTFYNICHGKNFYFLLESTSRR